jgi:hypothetical protein
MKLRSINTRIWDDSWISELSPNEKLVWLYLLTNQLTNLIGVYEITMKRIAFDTGLPIDTVRKAIEGFQRQKKAFYIDNHIMLVNFYANQSMNTKMIIGAKKVFDDLPENIKNHILTNPLKGYQSLSNGIDRVRKDEYEYEYEYELEDEKELENEDEIEKKKKEKKEVIFPFETKNFKTAWKNWKDYKAAEHNFKYKSEVSEQAALMQLGKLSQQNEQTAIEIIMQSIENGWKGFFELKTHNNNGQKQTGSGFDLQRAFNKIDEMFDRREARSGGGGNN